MAVVVVGGSGRKVGKTSVVVELTRAFSERKWTAVKISGHGERLKIHEETVAGQDTDSQRFLTAGADRAFWVEVPENQFAAAMPQILKLLEGSENVILESNTVVDFIDPDVILVLREVSPVRSKPSFKRIEHRADAFIVPEGADGALGSWTPPEAGGRRVFRRGKDGVGPDLVDFVRERLGWGLGERS